ncbi:MAG: NAD(P)-binding protein [Pseudomonadota bacterium]
MQLPAAIPSGSQKKKIAIFGGGIAALTTAFEITESPNWSNHYDVTIHQLGWRLGGKCATGRGPNQRIEEHGIHGFLGSYYNALPLMQRVFTACDRPASHPLATFDDALKPENFVLMWEFRDGNWVKWPLTMPSNKIKPGDPGELQTIETIYRDMSALLTSLFEPQLKQAGEKGDPIAKLIRTELARASETLLGHVASGLWADIKDECDKVREFLLSHISKDLLANDTIRRLYISIDYFLALMRGAIADDVHVKGFDHLDDVNFDAWLAKHGAHPITISSPLALNTPNLSYQYPSGDTSQKPEMAAGTYLHWTLRSFAYMGSFAYMFEVGTGESVIHPMYEALQKRGVKFEFFNKVTDLRMSDDGTSIAEVDIDIQATLKDPEAGYDPMIDTQPTWLNGTVMKGWPQCPNYDQLVEGDALIAQNINLESYWTPWQAVGKRTMKAGTDFDIAVYAIPVATIPHLAPQLLEAQTPTGANWRAMCEGVTTSQTQTMQIWFSKTRQEMGLDFGLTGNNTVIGATYAGPINGQVDFSELIRWENFPEDNMPKCLWYFSGTMTDMSLDTPPPFSDHDYPRRARDRVRYQCIQYLEATMGSLMPKATTNTNDAPGDPMSLDFGLLVCTQDDEAKGVACFDQQFWRANIDPNERYTQSPPGSTACRIKAWETGYSNLVFAGDWAYTGLNVGSVEGTVMSGRLASHAVTAYPPLDQIPGFNPGSL